MANRAKMKPERRAAYDAKSHWSASSLDALALLPIAAATIPDAGKSRHTPKVCDPPDPELVAAVQHVQDLQRQLLDAIQALVRGALDRQDAFEKE